MQVQFPAAYWGFLAGFHFHPAEGDCAVVLSLDLVEEVLGAGALSCCGWVIVYLEIVREVVAALAVLGLEGVNEFCDLLYAVIHACDNFVFCDGLLHGTYRYL